MPDGILRGGYEALARGDAEPLLALLGDEFEWVDPDGTHVGPEGFSDGVLAPLGELLDGLTFLVDEVAELGDRAVVTGLMRGRPAGAEGDWEVPFAHVWELADGVPVSARSYFDRSRFSVAATRRQLAEVAEDLMEQAAEIRRQWSRLGDALRAAGLEEAQAGSGLSSSSSALLAAVDMAQEGASREEVEAYLREELGVEDAAVVLDEAFGSGGAAGEPLEVDTSRVARLFARNRG